MQLPLAHQLKKQAYRQVAALQDELVQLAYELENDLVLHGGTAIWRCYGGNRFSEDLDFYGNANTLEEKLEEHAEKRGLKINKLKKTENLLFCKITDGQCEVRLEVNRSVKKTPTAAPFLKLDGSFLTVLTLTPEELILEKTRAYTNRRLIRDAYDLFHLSSRVTDENAVKKAMQSFLAQPPIPIDEKNLKTIIYSGAVPTFDQIIQALKRRWT